VRAIAGLFVALACATAGAQAPAPSISISVGGTPIALPIPRGFAEVPASLPELVRLGEQITPPGNRLLAHLVAPEDMKVLARQGSARFDRYFLVQTSRQVEGRAISQQEFAEVRALMKTQQAELFRKLGPKTAEFSRDIEKNLSRESGRALKLNLGDIVPLGVYADAASFITFGAMVRVRVQEGAEVDERTVVNVSSIILARSKLLFLYIYARFRDGRDVEWARKTALSWTSEVLARNR
jgi:hypothetical protein